MKLKGDEMIELHGVEKIYDYKNKKLLALDDINLKIKKGDIFGVVGKSGAGKSTLIRCINLLERPSKGSIFMNGEDLTALTLSKLRLARHKIGMIFQHFNLLNSRTVYQNIAFPLTLIKESRQVIDKKVSELLELTELTDKKNHYPHQLSGGQKQRVAIARAIVTNPHVLLCDEATSALDIHTTTAILNLLKDINENYGLTIILITHEMEVVKQICDRVALLDQGKIVEEANIVQFFTQPQTAMAKKLVKSCLRHELPPLLQNKLINQEYNNNPIIRIFFYGKSAADPIISNLMKQLDLEINILQANIEVIKNNTIGIMTIEIIDKNNNFSKGVEFLRNKGIDVEVIGYVSRNDE